MSALLSLALLLQATGAAPSPSPTPGRVVTLEEAVKTAGAHQPQLVAAIAAQQAAAARQSEAFTAFLPSAGASAKLLYFTNNPSVIPNTPPGFYQSWNVDQSVTLSASLSELIWDFGQSTNRYASAKALARSAEADLKATRLQVIETVRQAFFTARAAKAQVAVADETLANQKKHMEQTRGFVQVGTHPPIDLVTAQANVASARVSDIQAKNALDNAKVALNLAMGVIGPIDYDVSEESLPAIQGEDQALETLVNEALRIRPELVSLNERLLSAEKTLASIQADYAPTLSGSTGITDAGAGVSPPTSLTWNWTGGFTLSLPLAYSPFLVHAQVREARANVDGARAQVSAEELTIREAVETARLAVSAAIEASAAATDAVANAREQLRLAEGRYQTGAGSVIELDDAQVALTTAEAQKVQADFTLASARAALLQALGRE